MIDDIGAFNRGVDHRELLQGFDGGLGEKGHKAQPYVVTLLEVVAISLAQGHDLGEIHLVERGEHGSRLLRLDQPLGDARTQARHGNSLLAALESDDTALFRDRCRHIAGRDVAAVVVLEERHDVRLGNATILTGAGHHRGIEVVLLEEPAYRRAGLWRTTRCFLGLGRCCRGGGLGCFRGGRRLCRHLAFLEDCEHIARRYRRTFLDPNLSQRPGRWRWHFENNLVCFEIHQVLVALHSIARVLVPGDKGCIADRLGQRWHLDFNTHVGFRSVSRGFGDLLALTSMPSAASTSACCCCK